MCLADRSRGVLRVCVCVCVRTQLTRRRAENYAPEYEARGSSSRSSRSRAAEMEDDSTFDT